MHQMSQKRQTGFTLVEMMVAMAVTVIVLGGAMVVFRDSTQTNRSVNQTADMSDNTRAGVNMVVQDLILTGSGVPTGGIAVPNTVDATGCNKGVPINRPPAVLGLVFAGPTTARAGCNVVLPAIEPGPNLGPIVTSSDGTTGQKSDVVTILYADNTIPLNTIAINDPKCKAGSIAADGSTVTFDATCQPLGAAGIPISAGDLIMFNNANGSALQTVTSVGGQTLAFAANDAFNLNGRTAKDTAGTILQLQNIVGGKANGTYPATSATRVWMVTYYLDNLTDPLHPRLMRESNFNTPQIVSESVETLQFSFNLVDGTNPSPVNQRNVPINDNENQIRSVNVYLGSRSAMVAAGTSKFLRTNQSTQVALRSMAYFNTYQ
jgi:prepilin-type N-terminal cleavage/methylation domain-containing protein